MKKLLFSLLVVSSFAIVACEGKKAQTEESTEGSTVEQTAPATDTVATTSAPEQAPAK